MDCISYMKIQYSNYNLFKTKIIIYLKNVYEKKKLINH